MKRKRPGRPKGSGAGRTHTANPIVVKCTPEFRAACEEAAGELGVPLSEWAREAMANEMKRQREPG